MPKYRACVACDPSAYGHIEIEAETPEAAIGTLTIERVIEAVNDVEYDGAQNFRIVDMHELDENEDDGELVAEAVDLFEVPEEPNQAAALAALIAAGDGMAAAIEEAEANHVYDESNGDEQPDDCRYKLAREAWAAAKAGAAPPIRTIYVTCEGGLITGWACADPTPDLRITTVDYDVEGMERGRLVMVDQGPEAAERWQAAYVRPDQEIDHRPGIAAAERRLARLPEFDADFDGYQPDDEIAPGEFVKAIMAGYRVDGGSPGYMAWSPEDAALPADPAKPDHLYPTERAAWEAADNHRMFGDVRGAV